MRTCEVADCLRSTRSGRTLCEMHAKRLQRGIPVAAPVDESRGLRKMDPREVFLEAVLRYANADDDTEFKRAEWRLMDAGRRYFKQPAGRPPARAMGDVIRAWQKLHSIHGVAKALGISRRSVQRALTRAGVRKIRAPQPKED